MSGEAGRWKENGASKLRMEKSSHLAKDHHGTIFRRELNRGSISGLSVKKGSSANLSCKQVCFYTIRATQIEPPCSFIRSLFHSFNVISPPVRWRCRFLLMYYCKNLLYDSKFLYIHQKISHIDVINSFHVTFSYAIIVRITI